jgi:hypothetical protein
MIGRGLIANPFLPEMIQTRTRLICHETHALSNFTTIWYPDTVDGFPGLAMCWIG